MIFKTLLLILVLFTPFIESKSSLHATADTTIKNKMISNTSSEKIVIDHGLELYKSLQNHESDCFRKVTLVLNDGCNSLTYDSVQNMEYALMLTFCELGSAKWKLPKVCFEVSEAFNKASTKSIKQCVKRLSDTPQTWTSYSGYFRDVFLMCFAIRYPMEKEILEQIHRNITLNQARNFDILQEQQEYLVNWRREEFSTLNKIKDAQRRLLEQMEKVRGIHAKSADQIQLIFDALVLLQSQTEAVILKYNYLVKYHVGEVQNQLNQLVNRQEYEVDYVMSRVVNGLQKINQNIEEMITIQQEAVQSWSHSKDIQKEYLEAWTDSIIDVNKDLNNFLNESLTNVKSLHNDISSIHQQIKVFTIPFGGVLNVFLNFYTNVQRVILNLLMYGSLLHLIQMIFKCKTLFVRVLIMMTTSTVLHFSLRYILGNTHPHSILIKPCVIFIEWFTIVIFSAFARRPDAKFTFLFHDLDTNNVAIMKKKRDPFSQDRLTTQPQRVPATHNDHLEWEKKERHPEATKAENFQKSDTKRRNNVKNLDGEHKRFPVYQFHKYYFVN